MAKLSTMPRDQMAALARSLADTGIAVTVLPATDLFLMGRDQDHNVRRGVADANLLIEQATKSELLINLKIAKALGLKIPQSLLLRAYEVIP